MNKIHCGMAAIGGAAAVAVLSYADVHRFVTRRYRINAGAVRKSFRMAVLADLHDQVYGRHNRKLLDAVDAISPDLVVSVGDLITAHANGAHQEGGESTALLMTLSRRYPLIAINGNHETRIDVMRDRYGYGADYDDYESLVLSAGGLLLRNERAVLPEYGVAFTGLELPLSYFGHVLRKPLFSKDLKDMVGKPVKGLYNVLLAHHPDYFPEYKRWGANLVLSGHIHGGIVRLPFLGGAVSPTWHLFPKYDGGEFVEDGSTLVLSRGLGTHTLPVRLFNPGELVVVDVMRGDG